MSPGRGRNGPDLMETETDDFHTRVFGGQQQDRPPRSAGWGSHQLTVELNGSRK